MTVDGVLRARSPGVLHVAIGPDMTAAVRIDDDTPLAEATRGGITLTPGVHRIRIDTTLTGDQWRFETFWKGADLWAAARATVTDPLPFDRAGRPWGKGVAACLLV